MHYYAVSSRETARKLSCDEVQQAFDYYAALRHVSRSPAV